MSRIFREIFCGHFPWKLKDENLRNISPKFRRIFRTISQGLRSGGLRAQSFGWERREKRPKKKKSSKSKSKDFQKTRKRLVAHDCGYPLSRYTCRATRVASDFLLFIAFCRCSTGVALHPLKYGVAPPPPCAGRCRTEIWVLKGVALHGGVAATVAGVALHCATKRKRRSGKLHP